MVCWFPFNNGRYFESVSFIVWVLFNWLSVFKFFCLFWNGSSFQKLSCSLLPWFVTGYTDAEGSYPFSLLRSKTKIGWRVLPSFEIGALNNSANRKLLESFKTFFGGGQIYLTGNQLYYKVFDLPTLLKFEITFYFTH